LLCQRDSCRQQAGGHHNCQCFDRHNCSCCFSFLATTRPPFTRNRPRAPKCGAAAEITVYLSDLTCSPLTGCRAVGDSPGCVAALHSALWPAPASQVVEGPVNEADADKSATREVFVAASAARSRMTVRKARCVFMASFEATVRS
jgi:hypothetical protein